MTSLEVGDVALTTDLARMRTQQYYVYIVASLSKRLYTGVTNNLERRVFQHKTREQDGFTKRYHVGRLVYFEAFRDVHDAIRREKEIKGWRRAKKIALIASMNPTWKDLSAGWFDAWSSA